MHKITQRTPIMYQLIMTYNINVVYSHYLPESAIKKQSPWGRYKYDISELSVFPQNLISLRFIALSGNRHIS